MKNVSRFISWIALLGTVLPCLLFFGGLMDLIQVKQVMLVTAVVWFIATPLWMERRSGQ